MGKVLPFHKPQSLDELPPTTRIKLCKFAMDIRKIAARSGSDDLLPAERDAYEQLYKELLGVLHVHWPTPEGEHYPASAHARALMEAHPEDGLTKIVNEVFNHTKTSRFR